MPHEGDGQCQRDGVRPGTASASSVAPLIPRHAFFLRQPWSRIAISFVTIGIARTPSMILCNAPKDHRNFSVLLYRHWGVVKWFLD